MKHYLILFYAYIIEQYRSLLMFNNNTIQYSAVHSHVDLITILYNKRTCSR